MPQKLYFSCFFRAKILKVKRTFLTPSRQPRFSWNLATLLSDAAIFVFFFHFRIIIFSKESAHDLSPLTLCYCPTRTNARVKNLRHGFLAERAKKKMQCFSFSSAHSQWGWGWFYTNICFCQSLNYTLSYDFEIFEGMSHNLELLSFQRMCGLLGFIRKMKALQRSVHRQSWRVAEYVRGFIILQLHALINSIAQPVIPRDFWQLYIIYFTNTKLVHKFHNNPWTKWQCFFLELLWPLNW